MSNRWKHDIIYIERFQNHGTRTVYILFSGVFSGGKRAWPENFASVRATIHYSTLRHFDYSIQRVFRAQQRNKRKKVSSIFFQILFTKTSLQIYIVSQTFLWYRNVFWALAAASLISL